MPRIITYICDRCGREFAKEPQVTLCRGLGPALEEKAVWLCDPCGEAFRVFLARPVEPAS
jgi:hypothetical protein